MTVPALRINATVLAHITIIMVLASGCWYIGSSMIKGASCFHSVLLTIIPAIPSTAIFKARMLHDTYAAFGPKIAAETSVRTASRAVQGTKGIRSNVIILALRVSIILAPSTAGTLQPNPRHIGIKLFPCRPTRCMMRSITKAARAM